jgi:uncharacterized damage-inducible protein DinB
VITIDLTELRELALAEADRLINWVETLSDEDLNAVFDYHTMAGTPHTQLRRESLAHLNNHQTHHRSQATTCLSILGEPFPELDLLYFQRS